MPDWTGEIRAAIASLQMDAAREASLVEELSQHLSDRYDDLRTNGLDDAGACALLKAELNDGTLDVGLKPLLSPSPEAAFAKIDKRERMLAGVGNDVATHCDCYVAIRDSRLWQFFRSHWALEQTPPSSS